MERAEERVPAGARIALIASSYFPAVGGVEQHVRSIASALRARGHEVEVWTVDRDGGHSETEVEGTRVRHLPTPLPASTPQAIVRFVRRGPSAFGLWRAAVREFRPDVLHVQCFGPNGVYALALSQRTRIPLVVTSHGETLGDDDNVYAQSAILRWSLRRAIRRSAAVTAPSQYVLDDLRRRFGLSAGEVVTNGIDLDQEARGVPDGAPFFFAVGRLGAMKGFDLLVRAFRAAELGPDVRLCIGGDGPERSSLERLAEEQGVSARVEFRGWMTTEEVARVMSEAMAVVVPSRSEAFGIVALEAWRAGAPLIMTSRGGAAEFITDGEDGVLVDPLDTGQLSAALERVARDARLREELSERGRMSVRAFDWSEVAGRYEALYRRLSLPRRRGRAG